MHAAKAVRLAGLCGRRASFKLRYLAEAPRARFLKGRFSESRNTCAEFGAHPAELFTVKRLAMKTMTPVRDKWVSYLENFLSRKREWLAFWRIVELERG